MCKRPKYHHLYRVVVISNIMVMAANVFVVNVDVNLLRLR